MTKSKLKQIGIAVLIAVAVSTGFYFIVLSRSNVEKTDIKIAEKTDINEEDIKIALERPNDQLFGWQYPVALLPEVGSTGEKLAYSTIRDPGGIPQGLPVRLKIPVIGVDSAIEDALITPDGRMDVPYGSVNVAWFSLGPKPGRAGSAVIGGHFGINAGVKFVFYDLDKLVVGDRIHILDDNGETLAFQVRRIELLERDADATTVFTSDDGLAHLNLITCEGLWNRVNDTYPLRRVVFTDLISAEEAPKAAEVAAATEPTLPSTAFFRSLSIGNRGTAVTELQTMLVEKGFLVIPRGVSKGYFGPLTRAAVVKYQASIGLSSTGIFDAATRAKLIPATVVAMEPTIPSILPSTAIPLESQSLPKIIIEYIKSLYATPTDGLITSMLLMAIVFTAFYTIKRN